MSLLKCDESSYYIITKVIYAKIKAGWCENMNFSGNHKTIIKMIIVLSVSIILMIFGVYSYPDYKANVGQHRFGATYMTMNNPFFEVINNEIKKAVEANGDVLITLDPILDVDKQNEQIFDLIEQRVDAIFVNPIDAKKIEIGLQAAKKAKIPVIVVDAPIYDESLVDCSIASNNYDAGVQCAKDMMLKKENANIILLEHATAKSAVERIQGFLDTIGQNSNYKIINRADCDGQIEIAMPITKEMLEQTPNVDVVMALNDRSALGALAAIESKGIKDVLVYGVDGSPDVKELIKAGLIQATAAQSPIKMGQLAYQSAKELLLKNKIEKIIEVPVELINQDNISKYDLVGWQ